MVTVGIKQETSLLPHPFPGPCLKAGDATHHCVCSDGFIVGRQVEMCYRVALTLEHGKNLEISYPSVYLTVEGHPKPGGLSVTPTCFISSGPQISFGFPRGTTLPRRYNGCI
jgi:acetamidase/formamidase